MIRSFGVARVMSVKRMQMRAPGRIHSASGRHPMGETSAASSARRSSSSPAWADGWITVVRSSGNSTGRFPVP
jgi:hypothetical protein